MTSLDNSIIEIEAEAARLGAVLVASFTDEQVRNLRTVIKWGEYYNSDVSRMITECYTPDCTVDVKGAIVYSGHAPYLTLEHGVNRLAPNRYGSAERIIALGNVVVVQGLLTDPDRGPDWNTPFCSVLTMRDGKIHRDETYLDLAQWPSPLLAPWDISAIGLTPHRPIVQLAVVALPAIAVRKLCVGIERLRRLAR